MSYPLSCTELVSYDPGKPSITVAVITEMSEDTIGSNPASQRPVVHTYETEGVPRPRRGTALGQTVREPTLSSEKLALAARLWPKSCSSGTAQA